MRTTELVRDLVLRAVAHAARTACTLAFGLLLFDALSGRYVGPYTPGTRLLLVLGLSAGAAVLRTLVPRSRAHV